MGTHTFFTNSDFHSENNNDSQVKSHIKKITLTSITSTKREAIKMHCVTV
jgi:hypothetical protein